MQFRIIRYERIGGQKTAPKPPGKSMDGEGVSAHSIRGAGDVLARVLQPGVRLLDSMFGTALGECEQCKARRQALNELLPFRRS